MKTQTHLQLIAILFISSLGGLGTSTHQYKYPMLEEVKAKKKWRVMSSKREKWHPPNQLEIITHLLNTRLDFRV